MKTIFSILTLASVICLISSCNKSEIENVKSVSGNEFKSGEGLPVRNEPIITAQQDIMDAYLDRHIFSFRVKIFTGPAAKELIAQTPVVNSMFVYDAKQLAELNGKKLLSITDAKEPLHGTAIVWKEYVIQFARGVAPQQFFSVQDLAAAISESHEQITITETGNVLQGNLFMPAFVGSRASSDRN